MIQDATLHALSAGQDTVEVENFAHIFAPRIGMAGSQSNIFVTGSDLALDELTTFPTTQDQGGAEKAQRPRDTRNP